jgi:hypothetical protein
VCGGQTPDCVGGACVCNAGSCGDYYRCDGVGCVLCNTPEYCGASCSACVAPTPFCTADGAGCVECLVDGDCPVDEICVGSACEVACQPLGCEGDTSPNGADCDSAWVVGRVEAAADYDDYD